MVKSLVYRNCPKCKQIRVPHIVLENRKDSPVQCESCGYIYSRKGKKYQRTIFDELGL